MRPRSEGAGIVTAVAGVTVVAQVQPLAWEVPHVTDVTKKKKSKAKQSFQATLRVFCEQFLLISSKIWSVVQNCLLLGAVGFP